MDTIIISDDEEADISVRIISEYKPTTVKLDEPFLDPPTSPIVLDSPSPPHVPDSLSQQFVPGSPFPTLISPSPPLIRDPRSPPQLVEESPSPPLISDSPSPPLIEDSPSPSPPLITDSPKPSALANSSTSDCESSTPHKHRKAPSSKAAAAAANRAAREELRKQKQRVREIERIHKEANKANTASKATQNCTAVVDRKILKLISDDDEANFTTLFEESSLTYKITDYPRLDNSVTWTFKRTEVENDKCVVRTNDTDLILVVMDGSEYSRKILLFRDDPSNPQSLNNYICDIKNQFQSMIVILVYNLNNYIKAERAKEAKNYQRKFKERFETGTANGTRDQTDSISGIGPFDLQDMRLSLLIDLHHAHQDLKVNIEFREKTQEIVDSIVKYTKSVAGREIKKKERAATNIDWAINMDKEKAFDPARSAEDRAKLWIAQLQQFSQITLPVAKAIAAEYPSPMALLDTYETLTTGEAQDLLAELHVQKNLKRQVGQNLSRKIYRLLTSEDPNLHIGYD